MVYLYFREVNRPALKIFLSKIHPNMAISFDNVRIFGANGFTPQVVFPPNRSATS